MQSIKFDTTFNPKDPSIKIPPQYADELASNVGQDVAVTVTVVKNQPIKKKTGLIRELMDNPLKADKDFKFLSREEANER